MLTNMLTRFYIVSGNLELSYILLFLEWWRFSLLKYKCTRIDINWICRW